MLRGVLIDIVGTVLEGSSATPIPGAVEAIARLRAAGIPFRFVSNMSDDCTATLLNRLATAGFDVQPHEVFTALSACRSALEHYQCKKPLLFLSADAKKDFASFASPQDATEIDAVVLGLAPSDFVYDRLQLAFEALTRQNTTINTAATATADANSSTSTSIPFIAAHAGRYYAESNGKLWLGPGPFVAALTQATGVEAHIVGKPSAAFFQAARQSCRPTEFKGGREVDSSCAAMIVNDDDPLCWIMIGDDVRDDVQGAIKCGMHGCLVQTGKYRKGDELVVDNQTNFRLASSIVAAIDRIVAEINGGA